MLRSLVGSEMCIRDSTCTCTCACTCTRARTCTCTRTFDPKQTRRRKFTYYGTVLSVDVHAKTKGGKDMVSVRVRWHEKGEPIEPVFLNPGMHCELGCEHGWAAVDDGDCSDPREQDDQLHAKAKQRKLDHDCLAFPPPM